MQYLRLDKISDTKYDIIFVSNAKKIGEAIMDVDGYFHYWTEDGRGSFSDWTLRLIADELTKLNEPWDKQVEAYFERERKENETGEV